MPIKNELNEIQDLYIPRKCHATGAVIDAKDHASVILNIAKVKLFNNNE
jgi:small subunit ribosomal protein S21e